MLCCQTGNQFTLFGNRHATFTGRLIFSMILQTQRNPNHYKCRLLALSLGLMWSGSSVFAAGIEAVKLRETEQGIWLLEARQADLPQLIEQVAKRSHSKIHYSSLPPDKVDATCVGNPATLLQCVLGGTANMAYQQAKNGQNSEIWIMGSSLSITNTGKQSCTALPEQTDSDSPDTLQTTEKWLKQATVKNAASRAQALAELANGDTAYDKQIRQTLHNSLQDHDPQVRIQALQALSKREGDADISEQLRTALHDNNPDVRLTAVENIHTEIELLQQAIHDSEIIVREFAQSKLDLLNHP
ncbi:MAG: hypothetical protein CTY19_15970 [Methylomonas sp.]|nr:MAG: hypothetical protein CTY19_15970 [Methylomonas sp.]